MTPQDFILSKLASLAIPDQAEIKDENLAEFIIKKITSKKFRKYAIDESLAKLIENCSTKFNLKQ